MNTLLNRCVNVFQSKRTFWVMILVGMIVFIVFGLAVSSWAFIDDDWGYAFYSQVSSFWEIKKFFKGLTAQQTIISCGLPGSETRLPTFFDVFYRPIDFIISTIQISYLKMSPYALYLTSVGLHAINAMLLFRLCAYLLKDLWLALFGALFSAFVATIGIWLGWFVGMQYQQALLVFLILMLTLLKAEEKQSRSLYYVSYLIFFLALFVRETIAVFPAWFALYLFCEYGDQRIGFSERLKRAWKGSYQFFLIFFGYLAIRLSLFPLVIKSGMELDPFSLKERFLSKNALDFVYLMYESFGFSLLPKGMYKPFKVVLLGLVMVGLGYLFVRARNKLVVSLYGAGFVMFMWQVILRYYHPRYLHEASPFFILMILFLLQPYWNRVKEQPRRKWAVIIFIFSYIVANASWGISMLKYREKELALVQRAVDEFGQLITQKLHTSPLPELTIVAVGLPHYWFPSSVASAFWLAAHQSDFGVYHSMGLNSNGPTYIEASDFGAFATADGCRIITFNKERHSVPSPTGNEGFWPVVITRGEDDKGFGVFVKVKDEWRNKRLWLVSWDYAQNKLIVVAQFNEPDKI